MTHNFRNARFCAPSFPPSSTFVGAFDTCSKGGCEGRLLALIRLREVRSFAERKPLNFLLRRSEIRTDICIGAQLLGRTRDLIQISDNWLHDLNFERIFKDNFTNAKILFLFPDIMFLYKNLILKIIHLLFLFHLFIWGEYIISLLF